MRVETLSGADWRLWRDLRVEGIRDAPIGFLETYEEAVRVPDEEWQARLASTVRPAVHLAVYDGDEPVGIAGVFREATGAPILFGVYVRPPARGGRALAALVDAAAAWAAPDPLVLEVHEANARAVRAYEKLGFVPTGERRVGAGLDGGDLVRMRRG